VLDETVRKEGEEKGGKGERGRREREEGNKEEEIKKKRRGKKWGKKRFTVDRASVLVFCRGKVSLCEFLMGILKKVNRMVSSWREKKDFWFFFLTFFCFFL